MDHHKNIIIADGQYLVIHSLKQFIKKEFGLDAGLIIPDKAELQKALRRGGNTLVIVDPDYFDLDDAAIFEYSLTNKDASKVMILTNSVSESELQHYKSAGIQNIVLKTTSPDDLKQATKSALEDKMYFDREILLMFAHKKNAAGEKMNKPLLTKSELDIVKLIADGFTTKEIAARKYISYHTVITHRKNIFRKLEVGSISELVIYAIRQGWIDTIDYHI